jgi:hypothetical protein
MMPNKHIRSNIKKRRCALLFAAGDVGYVSSGKRSQGTASALLPGS